MSQWHFQVPVFIFSSQHPKLTNKNKCSMTCICPVGSWSISNYAGTQRIKIVTWLQIPCSQMEKSSNKSHELLLWSDIRQYPTVKSFFAKENLIGLWHVQRLLAMNVWCLRFCYSDHWFFEKKDSEIFIIYNRKVVNILA